MTVYFPLPEIHDGFYPSLRDTRQIMLAPRDTRLFISLSSRYTTVYIPLSGIRDSLYPSPRDA